MIPTPGTHLFKLKLQRLQVPTKQYTGTTNYARNQLKHLQESGGGQLSRRRSWRIRKELIQDAVKKLVLLTKQF